MTCICFATALAKRREKERKPVFGPVVKCGSWCSLLATMPKYPYVALCFPIASCTADVRAQLAEAHAMCLRMPQKANRQKAARFNPVTGGKLIVVQGGWAAGSVEMPVALVAGDMFVHADLHSNGAPFALLVFGKKKTTATERAKVTVLQSLMRQTRETVEVDDEDARNGAARTRDASARPSKANAG